MKISRRKSEHIKVSLEQDVRFKNKTPGFEAYRFIHCALPEINFNDVSTEVEFLGKVLSYPMMISALTGGYDGALEINQQLAEVCREEKVAMSVGSQRQTIENDHYLESFRVVRKIASEGVIIGNIGAAQVSAINDISPFQKMVDLIQADAMAVHLNPLQEVLQPEGDTKFKGVLKGIERLVKELKVPIIVKEVGCGISEKVAKKLVNAGVAYIEISGAGGTSWAGIESYRGAKKHLALSFWDWGIPTARSLEMVRKVKGARIIASGGIEDGITIAKALALGAELCGSALPLLKVLMDKKIEGLRSLLQSWREELKVAMFLTGSRSINDLRRDGVIEKV